MKKLIIFCLILSLAACAGGEDPQKTTALQVETVDNAQTGQAASAPTAQAERAVEGERATEEASEPSQNSLFPKPQGWINDFESVLTDTEIGNLQEMVKAYEEKTSKEIAIVTTSSIEPYKNLTDYSNDLFNEWGIGKKEKNNGLVFVLCKNRREVRISTGLGAENQLTNKICQQIIDEKMIPQLKKNQPFEALKEGVESAIAQW